MPAGMDMDMGRQRGDGPPVAATAHYMESGQGSGANSSDYNYTVVTIDGIQTEVPMEAAAAYSSGSGANNLPTIAVATSYKPVTSSGGAGIPYATSPRTSTSAATMSQDEALARALARADAAEAELAAIRQLE